MSEFGTLDFDALAVEEKRLDESEGGFLDQFVPMPKSNGSLTIRILPPAKGGKLFQATRLHLLNGRKLHDPKNLVNGKWDRTENPILDCYNAMWRNIDRMVKEGAPKEQIEKAKSEARKLKPIERYYYNAIIRQLTNKAGQIEKNVGPRILSVGKTIHKMILRAILGDKNEAPLGDVTHPKTGYDFLIRVDMKGGGDESWPDYNQSKFVRDPSPLGTPEEIEKWCANLHDLSKLRKPATFEELEYELAVHRGLIEDTKNETWSQEKFDAKIKGQRSGGGNSRPAQTQEERLASVVAEAPSASEPSELDQAVDSEEFMSKLDEIRASIG